MYVCCVLRLLQGMKEETKSEIADNMWLKKQVEKTAVHLFIHMVPVQFLDQLTKCLMVT